MKCFSKRQKLFCNIIFVGSVISVMIIFSSPIDSSTTEHLYTTNIVETSTKETEIIPQEDDSVKSLIESIMVEKNLSQDNFAFFYYNVDSNEYYFFNEDKYFTAASTVKVPISMLYYDMINAGEICKEDKITYESGCYEAGDGQTASLYSVSDDVPIGFLLDQAILYSDNTAINILIRNLGYSNCRKMISYYADGIDFYDEFYTSNIVNAKYGYELMSYLYENISDYNELINNMKQSSYGKYLKKYLDVDVAHKYGSYNGYVHDYGIVFDDTTYLIGIYTCGVTDASELIAEISLDVNEIV